MSRLANPWLMAAAAALVAIGASSAKAAELKPIDQAAIERSWAIQAELARIEQNKEAFVDELLGSWAPQLDRAVYDVRAELKPIAMAAYPWRLYGASLVGDFKTMVRLLRGEVGAGQYVNALAQPQPRMPVDRMALGGTTDSLVFTPIAPCRIVDTRGTGARTGIVSPGTPRDFDLTTSGLAEGQGGDTVCAGLPSFSHGAWAANVSVTGFTTNGNLRAFGFTGTLPSASFINFFPAASALANAGTLPGCFGCADDVTVQVFGGPTHVIIDVTGYYEQATGFGTSNVTGAVVITNLAGVNTSIPANTSVFINGGACPAGTVLVSGGQTNSSGTGVVTSDHFRSGTLWRMYLRNGEGVANTATVTSHCIDVN